MITCTIQFKSVYRRINSIIPFWRLRLKISYSAHGSCDIHPWAMRVLGNIKK